MSRVKVLHKFETELSPLDLYKEPKLEHFYIRLNNICNAKCEFCDVWKTVEDHHPAIDFRAIVDDLRLLSVREVNFHGGEAFLSRTFLKILELFDDKISFSVTTNGSFFRPAMTDKLAKLGLSRVYVSIDHEDPVLNAKSRGIPKLSTTLYPQLRDIKERYPSIQIVVNHVVSSFNIDCIAGFLTRMTDIGVDAVNLIPIKDYPALFVSPSQIKTFNDTLDDKLANGSIQKNFFLGEHTKIFGSNEQEWNQASRGIYGISKSSCIVPSAVAFLDGISGNIFPCDTTMYRDDPGHYIMGNILEDTLQNIWNGDKFTNFRKQMYPKICHKCVIGCDPANSIL